MLALQFLSSRWARTWQKVVESLKRMNDVRFVHRVRVVQNEVLIVKAPRRKLALPAPERS